MASITEQKIYTFDMGDGTTPWKISSRFVEKVDGPDGPIVMVTLAPFDWAFVDLILPRRKKETRGTLSGSEGLVSLIAMRNTACDELLARTAPAPPAAVLFESPAEPANGGKRKRSLGGTGDHPPTVTFDLDMKDGSSMAIEAKWPTLERAVFTMKLDASQLELVVRYVRSCANQSSEPRRTKSHTASSSFSNVSDSQGEK